MCPVDHLQPEQERNPWLRLDRLPDSPFKCLICYKSHPKFHSSRLIECRRFLSVPSQRSGIKVYFWEGVRQISQKWSQSCPLFPAASVEAGLIFSGMKSAFIFYLSNFLVLVFLHRTSLSLLPSSPAGAVCVRPALPHHEEPNLQPH